MKGEPREVPEEIVAASAVMDSREEGLGLEAFTSQDARAGSQVTAHDPAVELRVKLDAANEVTDRERGDGIEGCPGENERPRRRTRHGVDVRRVDVEGAR